MRLSCDAGGSTLRGLRPYPRMKDSRVEWLGDVPAHWEVTALRHRYDQCLGKMLDEKLITGQYLVPYLRNVDVQWDRINVSGLPKIDIRPHEIERYTLRSGDLLVCEGGEVGRCAMWEGAIETCGYQKALHRLRPCLPERDRPRFLLYALQCAAQRAAFNDGQESTIGHLTGEKLRAHRFAFPPAAEQRCIEAFLDHADQRIRRYVRAKQKLIALLEEQRRVIIHDAVTGRIDVRSGRPYPAYKDSGVEWLGSVPEHWERRRLKTLLRPVDHRSVDGSETLLSLRRDYGVVIYTEHFSRPPQGDSLVGFKLVVPGQLVVNRLQANNGLVFCSALSGLVSPDYSVFERTTPVYTRYLSDLIRTSTYRAHFRRQATGLGTGSAGFLRIYDDDFLATPVALPSSVEQDAIVTYVDRALADVATSTGRVKRQVDLVHEYRTRLVADVVTGKLNVRAAATGLPDLEPLDAEEDPADDDHNRHSGSDGGGDAQEAVRRRMSSMRTVPRQRTGS